MKKIRLKKSDLTPSLLQQLLEYDPLTGFLYWKERNDCPEFNTKHAGKQAGSKGKKGYIYVSVYSRPIFAHRVAWAIHYGVLAPTEIDHIDGDGTNNSISNLRDANRFENNQNTGRRKHNKSGYKGVCLHKQSNLWKAEIRSNGEYRCLGYFKSAPEAHAAYVDAAHKLNGSFARTQ